MTTANNQTTDSLELSKMFHEIKNPLTLISSSLQLIESDHPEVQNFRFWNQTMKDLQNLRNMIDDLSSFQKAGTLNVQLINLFDFTEDLLESIEGFLLERNTPLTLDNSIDDLDFYGDESKLRQALVNLLKNASESSSAGSTIELHISADEDHLYLSVKDYGCGISPKQMDHLFEPFHTTKSYGTGLGLPIVQNIITSHNGSLSINSEIGAGTTFLISLPLSKNQQSVS